MPSSKIRAEQNEKGLRNAPKRCKAITGLFKYIWDLLFTFSKKLELYPKQNKHDLSYS